MVSVLARQIQSDLNKLTMTELEQEYNLVFLSNGYVEDLTENLTFATARDWADFIVSQESADFDVCNKMSKSHRFDDCSA
jgi:hypothetical protein